MAEYNPHQLRTQQRSGNSANATADVGHRSPLHPNDASSFVGFQQFVMQHNLSHGYVAPVVGDPSNAFYAPPVNPYAGNPYAFGYAPPLYDQPQWSTAYDPELVRKSTLVATASEFVPQSYTADQPNNNQQVFHAAADFIGAALAANSTVPDVPKATEPVQKPQPEAVPVLPANEPIKPAAEQPPVEVTVAGDSSQLAAQTADIKLSPSRGAIRKTYSNQQFSGNPPNGQHNNSNYHGSNHSNHNGAAHSAYNGRDYRDRDFNRHSRENNGQQRFQRGHQAQRAGHPDDERPNWRDNQQRSINGYSTTNGRSQSHYDSYSQHEARRMDSHHQQNGRPNRPPNSDSGHSNPFGRSAHQLNVQRLNSPSHPTRNNQPGKHSSEPKPQPPIKPSASTTSLNGPPPSDAARFDKKRHPEYKPNRNLKTPHSDDRLTGECSQREKLVREIDAGRLECLVCCEYIKPAQATWCCSSCHHIIHLSCIVRWANSSKDSTGWRCPACQHVTRPVPDAYWCFCGKQRNPQYNRNDVAHSCGELCERTAGCEHPCTLLCHPGPCATCHASVVRRCGCGRTERTMQCCQKDELLCTERCDKLLACGVHRCQRPCHAGECDACGDTVEHRCHCGRDRRTLECRRENNAQTRYTCGKPCNRQLTCKQHKCKRVCHEGECGDCELRPDAVRTCPCGKQPLGETARTSCTDAVPVCGAVCGRPLKCGPPAKPHTCANKCHAGACAPCGKETAVRCRCGHMEQMMECRTLQTRADDARCKKRCTKKRSCGKHKCNQECCIDIDHVCPMRCTFTLSCGKHKCDEACHKGRCQPCYRSSFTELFCECGGEVIYPPVPCGSKRPACERPCSRAHGCDHPVTHNCHAAARCPPCMAFVAIRCHGGHEERKTIPCSQGEFSCGLKCGRALRCGRHRCLRTCHAGDCEQPGDVCKQLCTSVRPMCGHACAAVCHEGDCPETACRQQVEVLCQCGNRKAKRTCQEFANEYRRIASAKFALTMETMQQQGGATMVELSEVLGPIKLSQNKTLECNDECKLLERNRRLALGLQIRNPADMASKYAPKYSEFAKGWARKDPTLVAMVHEKLTELVKLAKQSQQKTRSHSFPTMNKEKRQLVHEMCQAFGVESVAYDAEPNRNVVASATRDTSWLPSQSLLEVTKRESGQRRIPVPMNNAWGVKR